MKQKPKFNPNLRSYSAMAAAFLAMGPNVNGQVVCGTIGATLSPGDPSSVPIDLDNDGITDLVINNQNAIGSTPPYNFGAVVVFAGKNDPSVGANYFDFMSNPYGNQLQGFGSGAYFYPSALSTGANISSAGMLPSNARGDMWWGNGYTNSQFTPGTSAYLGVRVLLDCNNMNGLADDTHVYGYVQITMSNDGSGDIIIGDFGYDCSGQPITVASNELACNTMATPDLTVTKTDVLSQIAGTSLINYTVVVSNALNAGDAVNAIFNSGIDPLTKLVVGSVTTDQGVVTTGNTSGDMAVQVNIGDIVDNDQVTITFQVEVLPAPPGVLQVSCAGSLTGDNFTSQVTDDPDTGTVDDPTITLVQIPDLNLTKSDFVFSENGILKIQYDVIIKNDANAGDALNVIFSSGVDPQTSLIVGSVTTSNGLISLGNNVSDMTIEVEVGDIAPGQEVMISFQVQIIPKTGMLEILCAGLINGDNFSEIVSDDPDTVDLDDPTLTQITIPTLGQWGLMILGLFSFILGVLGIRQKDESRTPKIRRNDSK